jgi:hypothetical protein
MSYPNLQESSIEHSTQFFSQIDTTNSGAVSLGQIKDACYSHAAQHLSYTPAEPAFVPGILFAEGKTAESTFNQVEYISLQEKYLELSDTFASIDTTQTGSVLGSQLLSHYQPQPKPNLPVPTSSFWLEHVKEHESLTDESTLTLDAFLTLENTYNFTRYWPLQE